MLTLTRRQLWLAAGAALALGASTDEPPPARAWQVGIMVFEPPAGTEPAVAPTGWDWAGAGPDGLSILVRGSTAYPTPELAAARVLAPDQDGRVAWAVVDNPPQPVSGTSRYAVLDVRSSDGQRTGALVCATRNGYTGVLLVSGPRGWSPALRRALLSSIEVRRAP